MNQQSSVTQEGVSQAKLLGILAKHKALNQNGCGRRLLGNRRTCPDDVCMKVLTTVHVLRA